MLPRTAALLLALATITAPASARASDEARSAGAHPSWTVDSCLACHGKAEASAISPRLTRPCQTLCVSCHQFRDGHHPVGVTILRAVPAPLLLTTAGTNTCSTCHDTSRPQFDRSPWVSRSLFERIARRPSENRTYFLVMRNDKGQLCRICH